MPPALLSVVEVETFQAVPVRRDVVAWRDGAAVVRNEQELLQEGGLAQYLRHRDWLHRLAPR